MTVPLPPDTHIDDPPPDLSDLQADDALVLVVFWALAFVVFLQFFTRYVLNNSLGWTEEVARYLLIAVTFIGAIMATRKESHIAVEFLYRWPARRTRKAMQYAVDLIALAFYAWMAWTAVKLGNNTQQMMAVIDFPKAWVYWGVAASLVAMALYQALAFLRHVQTGTSRLIDPDGDHGPGPIIE